jgi:hypothetical protein
MAEPNDVGGDDALRWIGSEIRDRNLSLICRSRRTGLVDI